MSNGKETSKYRSLAKDTGLFAISMFGSKILNFLLTPLYTSVLATDEFGIADLIITTIQFVYPVFTLAIADATLRFAMDKEKSSECVLGTSLVFVLLSVIFIMLVKPIFGSDLGEYWTVFVSTFALFNLQNVLSNYAKGIGKTALFATQSLIQTAVIITSNIYFLLVMDMGLQGYLISTIIGYAVPTAMLFFGTKAYKSFKQVRVDLGLIKEMLAYSVPMIPTMLAWSLNTSLDKYMLIHMKGLGESGIYSVAHRIPTIVTTVTSVFLNAWQLFAISNNGDKKESEYYTSVCSTLNFVSVCGSLIIIISAKMLSGILFSGSYFVAWKCVPMLSLSAMYANLSFFLTSVYRAKKKTKSLFASVFFGAIVNAILNSLLIHKLGGVGAAIATAASFAVVYVVRFIMAQKYVRIKIDFFSNVFSNILLVLCAVLVTFEAPGDYLISYICFGLILLLNKKEIIQLMQLIKTKVLKKKSYKFDIWEQRDDQRL